MVAPPRGIGCRGARAPVLALLAACGAAACDTSPAPDSAAPSPSSPAVEAPTASPVVFDFGEIKKPAEYLAEPRFAGADAARGELLSFACAACHTLRAGQKAIVGPNLHGVFGRPAATLPGFDYSPALRASGLVWTPRSIEAWLADPQRFVVGTTMAFTGLRSENDRRDLIAYLLRATD